MTVVVVQQAAPPVVVTVNTGPAGEGVPVGGTTGQVLAKVNATNYNTQWVNSGTGGENTSVGPGFRMVGAEIRYDIASLTGV